MGLVGSEDGTGGMRTEGVGLDMARILRRERVDRIRMGTDRC